MSLVDHEFETQGDDIRQQAATVESVLAAKQAHDLMRVANGLPPDYTHTDGFIPSAIYAPEHPTAEQFEILAAQDGLFNLIRKYGAKRVMQWCRNLAVIAGEKV